MVNLHLGASPISPLLKKRQSGPPSFASCPWLCNSGPTPTPLHCSCPLISALFAPGRLDSSGFLPSIVSSPLLSLVPSSLPLSHLSSQNLKWKTSLSPVSLQLPPTPHSSLYVKASERHKKPSSQWRRTSMGQEETNEWKQGLPYCPRVFEVFSQRGL